MSSTAVALRRAVEEGKALVGWARIPCWGTSPAETYACVTASKPVSQMLFCQRFPSGMLSVMYKQLPGLSEAYCACNMLGQRMHWTEVV